MVIQHLLKEKDQQNQLFMRIHGAVYLADGAFCFRKEGAITTDTYYNACSIGKWFTYCNIQHLKLVMEFKGHFQIEVKYALFMNGIIQEKTLFSEEIAADTRMVWENNLPQEKEGVIYYKIEALEDESILYDAYYDCVPVEERKITIALNICTYKRERYLLRNLSLLQSEFLQNKNSELYGHLKVFIIDNGNTLECEKLSEENVLVYRNPNVGGAGGFTRGLIEIMKRHDEMAITHAVFMDDDIEIEPESIVRTFKILKLLRDEYTDAFISGAMLRLDKPSIQYENGALWNAGNCQFIDRGVDLQCFENVVRNERFIGKDYAAWWYCCIPFSVISEDNLPIPVFIHEDDVEYSLRNARNIITLNGIAIRHPVAEHKRVSSNEYYNLRNMIIVNSVYCPEYGRKQLSKKMLSNLLLMLLRYRYKDMKLVYRALKDFCRGPEWLLGLDAVSYHKEIQQNGYQLKDISDQLTNCKMGEHADFTEINSIHIIIEDAAKKGTLGKLMTQFLSLNGWLLPAKKDRYAYFMGVHPIDLYRTGKVILYDDVSGQGIEVQRSIKQIFVFIWLYLKALFLIVFKYKKSKRAYQKRYKELQSINYWKDVLELGNLESEMNSC